MSERAVIGCLLGTAVGDALGLALEGLSRSRQPRLFPDAAAYHLLPSGKGMCSDDAEHSCMLAQSLIRTAGWREPDEAARRFAADFGWRLRFWLLGLPAALHVWLRRQSDYRDAIVETVRLGGDTDTVAAVVGALVGARVGKKGIPPEWLRDLWEWPRTPVLSRQSAAVSCQQLPTANCPLSTANSPRPPAGRTARLIAV